MKKLIYLFLLLFTFGLNAQVGINTNTPDPSSIVDVFANNKGISFPKVNLSGIADNTTVLNPQRSLIVFNTNDALVGGVGYYYWTGNKWDFLFSDLNGYLLENLTKYYSKSNSTKEVFSSSDYFNTPNPIGSPLAGNNWRVVNDLTMTVEVDRPLNQTLFTVTGMTQASNTSSGGNIQSVIGIFVDDVLVDIKPISTPLVENCSYRPFTVYGTTNNLSAGSHSVKIAIKNLTSSQTVGITWGGKNTTGSCNNNNHLNDFEARMSAVVLINQPFNF
ncbi:MAG: hypothetical protein WCY16_00065 [Weeksellaceae bacterium]